MNISVSQGGRAARAASPLQVRHYLEARSALPSLFLQTTADEEHFRHVQIFAFPAYEEPQTLDCLI